MDLTVSDEVLHKDGGPAMIVTGFASGMVECCWYDGFRVRSEAFHVEELSPQRLPRACLANGAGHRASLPSE